MTEAVRSDWDELMLAMDVVDTLRHREAELDQIIGEEADNQALVEKVRGIYQAQGIEVSERLIHDAVSALIDERFSYTPPADGWRRNLAHFWIHRAKWGRRTGMAAALAALLGGGTWGVSEFRDSRETARQTRLVAEAVSDFNDQRTRLSNRISVLQKGMAQEMAFGPVAKSAGEALLAQARSAAAEAELNLASIAGIRPADRFTIDQIDNGDSYRWPASVGQPLEAAATAVNRGENALQQARSLAALETEFEALAQRGLDIASDEAARLAVGQAVNNVRGALTTNDGTAPQALSRLQQLVDTISASFDVRIVSRPGVQSGVWRHPDNNSRVRNYYIIVEAVDASGQSLRLPITSEETGQSEVVSMWGLRVDEKTYEAVKADKIDDGILQNALFGRKQAGRLEPEYRMDTTGGAITRW